MIQKRILSLLLVLLMALSFVPANLMLQVEASDEKTTRQVYLHARSGNYKEAEDNTTVYLGDTVNVYFAIDNPNRGKYIKKDDPQNEDIQNELAAVKAEVDAYRQEVVQKSKAAVTHITDRISTWWALSAEDVTQATKKLNLQKEIEGSAYFPFLKGLQRLADLTEEDFENGVFKVDAYLEKFDPVAYAVDAVFAEVYGGTETYGNEFTYLYEYEFFYLSKIQAALATIETDMATYAVNILAAENDEEKNVLKEALLAKYNKDNLTFINIDNSYDATLSKKAYTAYIRELMHFERVSETGAYYVGKDAEESIRHRDPQYDLSGYRVRIYFDPYYFQLKDKNNPMVYNTPGSYEAYTTESKDETVNNNTSSDSAITPLDGGLWPYKKPTYDTDKKAGYESVYATIFANGIHFPNKVAEDNPKWYNLCYLPLEPIRTGPTQVFIEPVSTTANAPVDDPNFPLTLYAKHNPKLSDKEFIPTFTAEPLHGGYHYINIVEKPVPQTPVANPAGGRHKEKVTVTLTSQETDCTIYYTRSDKAGVFVYSEPDPDSDGIILKDGPINLDLTTTLTYWAVRTENISEDEKDDPPTSAIKTHTYTVVPDWPYLWADASTPIITEYFKDAPFSVYPSVSGLTYNGTINSQKYFYYTFNDSLTAEQVPDGSDITAEKNGNPETEWVLLDYDHPSILIDGQRTLRMIARKAAECSDIAVFTLGICPEPVEAKDYVEGVRHSEPQEVVLYCPSTDGGINENAIIKYTTDGRDPEQFGTIYKDPITVSRDTVITATAYLLTPEGTEIYSRKKSTFTYIFDRYEPDMIDAFYPGGEYNDSVNVTLTAQSPEYTILYYIKDGSHVEGFEPDESLLTKYDNNQILVDKNKIIYAKIQYPDGSLGALHRFEYIIKPRPPIFSQTSTQFTNSISIDVSTDQADIANYINYDVYYTIDGTTPTKENNINGGADIHNIEIKEYTIIKAVVWADYGGGEGQYSEVVSHSYDLVKNKPTQPLTTLLPGRYYIHENGEPEGYTTRFLPVPGNTQIYYTISYNGEPISAPYPGEVDENGNPIAILYDPDDPETRDIPIKGETVIMAVAINTQGVRSEVGTFVYKVTPETPKAAPSAIIDDVNGDGKLPFIPVTAVPGATVTYVLTGNDGSECTVVFTAPEENGEFYINPADGLPYYGNNDEEPVPVSRVTGDATGFTGHMKLQIWAELDFVTSPTQTYLYDVQENVAAPAPPFADKAQGTYEEILQDDANHVLLVRAYSLNTDPTAVIEYRVGNDADNAQNPNLGWSIYPPDHDDCIRLKGYTNLQLRVRVGTEGNYRYSQLVSYVYEFKPLPPLFEKPSGTYANSVQNHIFYDEEEPERIPDITAEDGAYRYQIYFRWSLQHERDEKYNRPFFNIDETSSVKAYVVNTVTGQKSDTVMNYYVIDDGINESGVTIRAPYDTSLIAANKLATGAYAKGIFLDLTNPISGHKIEYQYRVKFRDGALSQWTGYSIFDENRPIMTNASMEYIEITAKVLDENGTSISSEPLNEIIRFVQYAAPETNIEKDPDTRGKIVLNEKQEIWVVNDYKQDANGNPEKKIVLYYTLNGQDPTDPNAERFLAVGEDGKDSNGKAFKLGEALKTYNPDGPLIIRAVYASCALDECHNCQSGDHANCLKPIYGEIGTYKYNTRDIQYVNKGGGGGGVTTIDKTRKYTVDIFGQEHPTHIGYIKGYPDGSVRPNGQITREEVAAILYRVKNHAYETPFVVTGEVFPDVQKDRWSVKEIEYMTEHEVIMGYPDGEFKPAQNLTRAEFAALIHRFAELGEPVKGEKAFPDIMEEHWAYDNVQALYGAGLLDGYEDGTFRPENQITRAEVMTVMNKLLGRNPSEPYVRSLHFNPFNDLEEDTWYYVIVLEATITHNYYLNNDGLEIKWEDCK